jgi:uncharacterized protein YciU (UPF0263 family)
VNNVIFNQLGAAHEIDTAERLGEKVKVDLDKESFYTLMLIAESKGITLNDYVNYLLAERLIDLGY